MQTVLVTGATGFVGSRFINRWAGEMKIIAPAHNELDITDTTSVERFFASHRPDVVLHLAAISNTGYCQEYPEESYLVNVKGAVNMAKGATSVGARFIFFSSDQVYNGCTRLGLLTEEEPLSPENVYAKHKLEAEQLILSIAPDAVILRATWMYDRRRDGMRTHPNFAVNIAAGIERGDTMVFPVREYRGITNIKEVVDFLPLTFSLAGGVYNYGSENRMNTYETACCYMEQIGGGGIIEADYERYPEHQRNISVSTDKIFRASGGAICFSDTLTGLRIFSEMM